MCIGLPCQIIGIDNSMPNTATATVNGVSRQIDITLLSHPDKPQSDLIGKWALVHVGFAMNLLDEEEAHATLEALKAMEELEPDVTHFLNGENT